ncbi:MAG: tyrosine-type recombinase/integrase [Oscillospiraceae bacterium]|nr:tyrosine-type recombinase/integrase [Oscillospiraceae bacterium]
MARIITSARIGDFESYLRSDEKSENTIEKYLRDVRAFCGFAGAKEVSKAVVMEFKASLVETYEVTSANSIIAAVNAFLRFMGWMDCCIKQYKVQKKAFCSEEKELTKAEYIRLVNTAKQKGNERLNLILQTICGTGIRVSELQFITVEAVRKGEAVVSCKNKTRTVFIIRELQKKLLNYIKTKGIATGCIFITKSGKPMSRCNIWREMKALCEQAGVSPEKVFPHNLRHLFARTFYGIEKDIAKLADILGHSSINTTRIYIITTGAEHKRKMENMRLII